MKNFIELNEIELIEITGGTRPSPILLIYDCIKAGWSFGKWLAE